MAEAGRSKPKKTPIIWDNQHTHPDGQHVGIVFYDESNKSYAGAELMNDATRYPDPQHMVTLERPLTNFAEDRRAALQWLGRQILMLTELIIIGDVETSGDSNFHLDVDRVGTEYTITLRVPEIVGEKGDKGDKGDTGDTGATGGTGTTGATGAQGEKGDKGDKGDMGDTGAEGDCGCTDAPNPTPAETDPNNNYCGIASYLSSWLDGEWRSTLNIIQAQADVSSAAAQALDFISGNPVAILANAFIAWAQTAFDAGVSALEAEITPDVLEHFQCLLYCRLKANGGYQDNTIEAWLTEIDGTSTGTNGGGLAAGNWTQFVRSIQASTLRFRANIGNLEPSASCEEICTDCGDTSTGCVLDSWQPYGGTDAVINSGTRTSHHLEISSVLGGDGHYYITLESDGDSNCCTLTTSIDGGDITITSGSANLSFYIPCGTSRDGIYSGVGRLTLGYGSFDMNCLLFRGDSPFTMEINT